MAKPRSVDAIQEEMNELLPLVVKAKAAHDISDKAVSMMIRINSHNNNEYASRAIHFKNLVNEWLDALARESNE